MRTTPAAIVLAATLAASILGQSQVSALDSDRQAMHFHDDENEEDRLFHPVEHFSVRRLDEDKIQVDVRAGDHVFVSHELSRVRNLYSKNGKLRIGSPDGQHVVKTREDRHAKFIFEGEHEFGWFTCSYRPEENRAHLFVHNGTKSFEVTHRERFLMDINSRDLATLPESEFWLEVTGADDTLLPPNVDDSAAESSRHLRRNLDADDEEEDDDDTDCSERTAPNDVILKSKNLKDLNILPGDETSEINRLVKAGYESRNATRTKKSAVVKTADLSSDELSPAGRRLADAYAFTPDCYTDDDRVHEVLVNVISDAAFYSIYGSEDDVQEAFETAIARASQVYTIQMNIKLVIQDTWIATDTASPSSWPDFADYTESDGCPYDLSDQLDDLTTWVRTLDDDEEQAAHFHLFTGCSASSSGVAYVGTLCNLNYNTGVTKKTSRTWKTFAHELGHGFAATHSFENGMYTTGGIMDYGDGTILGTSLYRFRLARRDQMCGEFETALSGSCAFINVYDDESGCGNTVISDDEECECVDGSTSCNGCKNCKLTDDTVECSTSKFYMVASGSPYSTGALSDEECCVDNKLLTADTACDDGYCGGGGLCTNPCESDSLSPCGYKNSGCRVKCTDGNTCSYNWRVNSVYVGYADYGTPCTTDDGAEGICGDGTGVCTYSGPPTPKPTKSPTKAPTSFPTKAPTSSPTSFPTSFPTEYPTVSPTAAPSVLKGVSFPSKKCAKKNRKCKITEDGLARFGNNDNYAFYAFEDITKKTKFKCNDKTFGFDPIPDQKKKFCWFAPMTFDFKLLAKNGKSGTVTKAGIVRYGVEDKYVFKTYESKTSIKCNEDEFGVDPAPNSSSKKCHVSYF
ncbi:Disintegrin and metalloproteinase domain-containing protein B [Hondaea fermentalgiana]|uniref:Disintegrin and metalloproteinase domain-containing protein B n=1 Tax=Hondaea fermentalgiana TaxID=2315210 RepID=A0A2R5G0M9_9STRA|nr:Disintegrin and metalloproteinase domain-containing protein B [Hondaea fermentalgiana]|eukprot:GBG24572.1 Disintegrin and metalloproteinase domain-containing protein B [Hondaea fermentalgiana]